MLIQYILTSGVPYIRVENIDNASCVFFHMGDICPIANELVRNHSQRDDKTYFQADSKKETNLKQDQLHF